MRGPSDLYGSCVVAGPNLTDRAEFPVISFFVFKNAKSRRLRFDLPVRCLELPLHAGLRVDVRREFRNFGTDKVEFVTGVAAHRIADPRDADRRMNSVLAFRHDVLSIAGQCQGSSRNGRPPEVASAMTRIQFAGVRHTGGFGSASCSLIGLKIAPVQFAAGCRHASSTQMLANLRQSAIPPSGDHLPCGVTRLLCTPMLPSIRIVLRLA